MTKYKHTVRACKLTMLVQAVVANLIAVLFIPLKSIYGLTYTQFGALVGINFVTQFVADAAFSGAIDKLGYRKIVLPCTLCSALGFVMLLLAPVMFGKNIFIGLIIATVIFAFSGGLAEILISPIVAGIGREEKGASMSFVHSFYAWGQIVAIAVTTLFLVIAGSKYWQIIVAFWAVLPVINFFMFLKTPLPPLVPEEKRENAKNLFFRPFFTFCLLAIFFGGASEIVINQWTSAFMENGLGISKVYGDLIGLCGFSFMLGLGRLLHGKHGEKFNLHKVLIIGSAAAVVCYLGTAFSPTVLSVVFCIICGFAVSLLWPGTIVLAADRFPLAGAWMFAVFAMFGDFGGAIAPYITGALIDGSVTGGAVASMAGFYGISAEQAAIRFGLAISAVYPLLALVCHLILFGLSKKKKVLDGSTLS